MMTMCSQVSRTGISMAMDGVTLVTASWLVEMETFTRDEAGTRSEHTLEAGTHRCVNITVFTQV